MAAPDSVPMTTHMISAPLHFGPKPANRLFSMFVPDIDAIIFSFAMFVD
ncbi:MAG: hypothetical protein JNK92_03310 [Dechloromonas sp.]|nr:hypothetical protein [Dechloromonas sp.]